MTTELKNLRNTALAGGFLIAVAVLVFLAAPSSPLVKIVSDGFPLLLSICAALLAYTLLRRQVKTRLGTRIWGAMTLGLFLWAIGEAIWTFYELVLQQDVPYPSAADVVWTVGYLPLILSLAFQYLALRTSVSRSSKILIASVLTGMIALILWLVVAPILTDPEAGTPVEMFFSLAYPIGDIFLISFGVALVAAILGGQLALSWGAISAGIVLLSFSDLLFSYGTWNGLYYPEGELNFLSGLFDTLYISAYIVWAIGLYLRLRMPETGQDVDMRAIVSDDRGKVPDSDAARQPAELNPDQEVALFGQIVNRAHEQEKDQRVSEGENPLRVYVNALVGLLDVLVTRAGGAGVRTAFEAVLNQKAQRMGCAVEIRNGRMVWKGEPPEPGCYAALLEEAIRYSKSVVATETIDRNLQEIEKHMPSRIVQAAEENRLRMVRWLDEKHG